MKGGAVRKFVSIIIIIVLVAPFFLSDPNEMDMSSILSPPGSVHLLGTDSLGRDMLSRLVSGSRNSVVIAGSVTVLSLFLGLLGGTVSLTSKVADEVIMRTMDALRALPAILLASLMMASCKGGLWTLVIVLTTVFVPQCARLVRSEGRKQLASGYHEAAIVTGLRQPWAMIRLVIRHALPLLKAQVPFIFSSACILESTLSFIGAGVSASTPTLGQMISEGRGVFMTHPRIVLLPLALLIFFTLCFSLQWKELHPDRGIIDEKS